MSEAVLDGILKQIARASKELSKYAPTEVNWRAQAEASAHVLVPWLRNSAGGLITCVNETLNAPRNVRNLWEKIKTDLVTSSPIVADLDRSLERECVLFESITGDMVSSIVAKYLIASYPGGTLESNGRSDYPDLFLRSNDYTMLPCFTRGGDTFGAALKGNDRPVRIPDGLEVKTCRNRVAVDCHYPHMGLHLVLLFEETDDAYNAKDVKIAFLSRRDYRKSSRTTRATTVKYSFGEKRFISLLPETPPSKPE